MKVFSLLAALSIAACATSSSPGVLLSVERVSPDAVRLTLDNGADRPIGYNLCTSVLQRRDGTTWSDVRTDEVCTMELRTLNPGFDATFEKRLPAGLAAGEYRYVTSVESPVGGSQMSVASGPFDHRPR